MSNTNRKPSVKRAARLGLLSALAALSFAVSVASPAQSAPTWMDHAHHVMCGDDYGRYCADSN